MSFILISMGIILILGFFIDFVEISLIIVPIFYPIALSLGIDMQWFAILIAMNLQTSFLTPPFGFSLFYLKGVAPKSIQYKINKKSKDEDNPHRDEDKTHLFGG
jgi:TRAP-type mannitol/chloroaromatic compound transport system permease large subunit